MLTANACAGPGQVLTVARHRRSDTVGLGTDDTVDTVDGTRAALRPARGPHPAQRPAFGGAWAPDSDDSDEFSDETASQSDASEDVTSPKNVTKPWEFRMGPYEPSVGSESGAETEDMSGDDDSVAGAATQPASHFGTAKGRWASVR